MPITEAFSESLQSYPIYTWTVLGVIVLGIVSFVLLSFISAPYGRHLRPGWGPTLNATAGTKSTSANTRKSGAPSSHSSSSP